MRFHFLRRHHELHDRSAALASQYVQRTPHEFRALSHSDQPDTLVPCVRRKSHAVIFYFQTYGILTAPRPLAFPHGVSHY
jgi:hypothetical protein